jgi:hypothetical protein
VDCRATHQVGTTVRTLLHWRHLVPGRHATYLTGP